MTASVDAWPCLCLVTWAIFLILTLGFISYSGIQMPLMQKIECSVISKQQENDLILFINFLCVSRMSEVPPDPLVRGLSST